MKHKVLFDGNGSSLIRVVGVGHYVPVAEAEALKAERDEAREQHAATLNRLYEIFNIDDSDGEVRAKWALLGASNCKAERDALAAQVEALRDALINIRHSPDDHCAEIAADVLDKTPQQHLAEALANTAEKFYYMGWEHSLSTKSYDGDHYACGKRLAKSFADSIRKGEV